jgi:hypothetical protein
MLTLTPKHMQVFSAAAMESFEDRVLAHLNKCFPKQCKGQSETELRETIRYGIKRAAKYGVIAERDVCKYIDFMMALGRDFDRDPKFPWAASILNNQAIREPTAKAKRLSEAYKKQTQPGGAHRVSR